MKFLNKILIAMAILSTLVTTAQEKLETKKIKGGYRTIHAEIIIDASPEQVWEVLTDAKSYSQWANL